MHAFIDDSQELDNPVLVVSENKISSVDFVNKMSKSAQKSVLSLSRFNLINELLTICIVDHLINYSIIMLFQKLALLLLAEDVEKDALAALIANKFQTGLVVFTTFKEFFSIH